MGAGGSAAPKHQSGVSRRDPFNDAVARLSVAGQDTLSPEERAELGKVHQDGPPMEQRRSIITIKPRKSVVTGRSFEDDDDYGDNRAFSLKPPRAATPESTPEEDTASSDNGAQRMAWPASKAPASKDQESRFSAPASKVSNSNNNSNENDLPESNYWQEVPPWEKPGAAGGQKKHLGAAMRVVQASVALGYCEDGGGGSSSSQPAEVPGAVHLQGFREKGRLGSARKRTWAGGRRAAGRADSLAQES
ncbi:unnamed protein product [Polarella glacialis]|uniref:Uncharacterized protein n=1 Tax=Polarella glacialis TaxID=89957 RepID=A0A813GW11_POLGL|nr:unnamed protein product [Polarella glacialis]